METVSGAQCVSILIDGQWIQEIRLRYEALALGRGGIAAVTAATGIRTRTG